MELIRVSDRLLERAARLLPIELRSLDAVHLATVQQLGGSLARLVTYDDRMSAAAHTLGWPVAAPS